MEKRKSSSDEERIKMIDKDEGLLCMWRNSHISKEGFVVLYRTSIDALIRKRARDTDR